MNILTDKYLKIYKEHLKTDVNAALKDIAAIDLSPNGFTFYTSVAVMSSSRIEGEQMEIDSYVKHKMQDIEYLPELVEKPNDLYKAYVYAQQNELNLTNFLHTHSLLQSTCYPKNGGGPTAKTRCWSWSTKRAGFSSRQPHSAW